MHTLYKLQHWKPKNVLCLFQLLHHHRSLIQFFLTIHFIEYMTSGFCLLIYVYKASTKHEALKVEYILVGTFINIWNFSVFLLSFFVILISLCVTDGWCSKIVLQFATFLFVLSTRYFRPAEECYPFIRYVIKHVFSPCMRTSLVETMHSYRSLSKKPIAKCYFKRGHYQPVRKSYIIL